MHDIRVDLKKNRLYVTLGKRDSEDELIDIVEKIAQACKTLKPGFTCLTDLREYEVGPEEDGEYIQMAQKHMVKAGLKSVVRVRKQFGSLAHFQFDRHSVNLGYHARNVTTIEEAEKLLDEGDQQPRSPHGSSAS
ncbi:MAG: hypothetical protein ACOZF0_22895 [Thermodesulfobacteriota bacterium]